MLIYVFLYVVKKLGNRSNISILIDVVLSGAMA